MRANYFQHFMALAVLSAVLFPLASTAQSFSRNCVRVNGQTPESIAKLTHTTEDKVKTAINVFDRIQVISRKVTTSDVPFAICDSPDFNAAASYQYAQLEINSGVLEQTSGDPNLLARVIGHEFAHFLLNHGLQGAIVEHYVLAEFFEDLFKLYRTGQFNRATAIASAKVHERKALAYHRDFETDADDLGFALTALAGFEVSGSARKISSLYASMGEKAIADRDSSHPGYLQRATLGDFLERNEMLRRNARSQLEKKNFDRLGKVSLDWVKALPESGAAYYYLSVWLNEANVSKSLLAETLEISVQSFAEPKLGRISQRMMGEKMDSVLQMCIALFRDDRKLESLECARYLGEQDMSTFKRETHWDNLLFISQKGFDANFQIWTSVTPGGQIYLSNIPSHRDPNYMTQMRAWKAPRPPIATQNDRIQSAFTKTDATAPRASKRNRAVFSDLVVAAREGTPDDIYVHLQAGARIDDQVDGFTPLGAAVLAGNRENAEYLVSQGATIRALDSFRMTAEDYARKTNQGDLARDLRSGFASLPQFANGCTLKNLCVDTNVVASQFGR